MLHCDWIVLLNIEKLFCLTVFKINIKKGSVHTFRGLYSCLTANNILSRHTQGLQKLVAHDDN
jgi:hypothetical protein